MISNLEVARPASLEPGGPDFDRISRFRGRGAQRVVACDDCVAKLDGWHLFGALMFLPAQFILGL